MKNQEILEKIKNRWERETKLIWDQGRWAAMEKILINTPEGLDYVRRLYARAVRRLAGLDKAGAELDKIIKELDK